MKPVRTWILIADGARARVVMNDGPGHGIKPVKGMKFEIDNDNSRDADQETYEDDKRQFAEELGQSLSKKLRKNEFDRMIIFASPAMLGELRHSLSSQVMDKVVEQVPKDLTHVPNKDLPKHLEMMLAV